MIKKLSYAVLTVAMASGLTLAASATASAGHCVENGEPGFSYFGTDHVQEDKHEAGQPGNAEGSHDGYHAGTSGASNCRTQSDPSTRAPGRN